MPYKHVSDPDMVAKSAAVAEAFTPELYQYLLSLLPTPQSYSELHQRFEASVAASLSGDPEKARECEEHRAELDTLVAGLYGLAKAAAVKDPKVPARLGLTAARGPASKPSLPPPHDPRIVYNGRRIMVSVTKIPAAKGYQVWACDGDPNVEANWRFEASSQNCRGIVLTDLDLSRTKWLRIRAMRGNTAGPWSNLTPI